MRKAVALVTIGTIELLAGGGAAVCVAGCGERDPTAQKG
jgi:hypothetical protein